MSEIGDVVQVKDLQDIDHILITDSQDIKAVLHDLGMDEEGVGCLLMRVAEDGNYEEVWAVESSVPYLRSYAQRVA